jgi:opacity protein-like surface antigen
MKKSSLALCLFLLALGAAQAVEIAAGLQYGHRTVADTRIRDVYGSGTVIFPFLEVRLWRGLGLDIGYEAGYSREGTIGLYEEPTRLTVGGLLVSLVYGRRFGFVAPYGGLGCGVFSYRQTIDSPYAFEEVDSSKLSVALSAGVRVYPARFLFVSLDFRYVPLKVKPFDEPVDLGGMRLALGLGGSFRL